MKRLIPVLALLSPLLTIGVPASVAAQPQMSLTCQFTSGPRQGQVVDFHGVPNAAPAPVGGSCADGQGSYGYAVPDRGDPQSYAPQPSPPGPARADVHSFVLGNKLYGWCLDDRDTAQAACVQYIVGVADTEAQHEMFKADPWACMPGDLTDGQLRDLVIKYLRDNPAIRHNSAANLVIFALKDAFPCPASQ